MKRAMKMLIVPVVITTVFVLMHVPSFAGEAGSSITTEQLAAWRADFQSDPHNVTMLNAVTKNDLYEIAFNRQKWLEIGETFSNRIEVEGITDQKSTGRCWLFAGYNVLRQRVREKYNMDNMEFSQSYGMFWDKLEKANLFLEAIIETSSMDLTERKVEWLFKHPFPDGGQWNMVVDLIHKYGVVPKEAMPESYSSSKSSTMNRIISQKLRKDAIILRTMHGEGKSVADLRSVKETMVGEIYRMLAINLGLPPSEFKWRPVDKDGKVGEMRSYTPQKFYRDVVGVDLGDYYYFLNSPAHEMNVMYSIDMDRDMVDRPDLSFANIPIGDLKNMALASVLDGEPVWFGCDVGQEHYRNDEMGLMAVDIIDYESVFGVDMSITKEERIKYHHSIPTHAMAFVGVDVENGRPLKWLVENSWGEDYGDKGFFTMTDRWFDEYLYAVVVHKKYIPEKMLTIFKKEPVVLPPWDPMFSVM